MAELKSWQALKVCGWPLNCSAQFACAHHSQDSVQSESCETGAQHRKAENAPCGGSFAAS